MRLTTKSRYGMRLILDLAEYAREGPIPLRNVSKRQNISLKYLEQLIRKLKRVGLIQTRRGPNGGHMLAKAPADITVGDIVRALEENTAITDCSERDVQLCGVCNRAGDCLSRWVWTEASEAMFKRLDQITIGSLLTERSVRLPASRRAV